MLKRDGKSAVLRGMCISFLEYTCNATNGSALMLSRDVEVIKSLLLSGRSDTIVPAVRIPLTAEFFLNTGGACDLGQGLSYADYVDELLTSFHEDGIVTIIDLHWNLRNLTQTSMALNVNSVDFWVAVSSRYGHNSLVWYELYNEPFLGYFAGWNNTNLTNQRDDLLYECYSHGDCVAQLNDGVGSPSGYLTVGMNAMVTAVRANDPNGMILLAGSGGWAYETKNLLRFAQEFEEDIGGNVMAVIHPYMGPWQKLRPGI